MAGASGDLASATHIAEQMVKLYGMNGSLISYRRHARRRQSIRRWRRWSEFRDVDRLLDQNFKRVKMLLEEQRGAVIAVAEALIEKHALMGDEVYELVARAESRTNGDANVDVPSANAPVFQIVPGGEKWMDHN